MTDLNELQISKDENGASIALKLERLVPVIESLFASHITTLAATQLIANARAEINGQIAQAIATASEQGKQLAVDQLTGGEVSASLDTIRELAENAHDLDGVLSNLVSIVGTKASQADLQDLINSIAALRLEIKGVDDFAALQPYDNINKINAKLKSLSNGDAAITNQLIAINAKFDEYLNKSGGTITGELGVLSTLTAQYLKVILGNAGLELRATDENGVAYIDFTSGGRGWDNDWRAQSSANGWEWQIIHGGDLGLGPGHRASINAHGNFWTSAYGWAHDYFTKKDDLKYSGLLALHHNTSWAHGLGQTPKRFGAYLECITAVVGWGQYAVGDRIAISSNDALSRSFTIYADATSIGMSYNGGNLDLSRKHNAGNLPINWSSPNWRIVFWAEK